MFFYPLIFLSVIQPHFSYVEVELAFGHYLRLKPKNSEAGSSFITINQEEQFCIFPASDDDDKNVLEKIVIQKGPKTILLAEINELVDLGKEEVSFNYYIIIDNSIIKSNYYQLSLPFRFKDKKFSLLHKLKEEKKIEKMQYSLLYSSKDKLYLGGLPEEEEKSYNHEASCDIDKTKDYWSCQIIEVYIGSSQTKEKTYVSKFPMKFDIGRKGSHSPRDFLQFLKEKYFTSLLKSDKCLFFQTISNKTYIECSYYDIVKLESLNFVFPDFVFEMSPFQLFENFVEEYTGNEKGYFIFSESFGSEEEWIFGQEFAKNILSTFDYEKAKVIFRSKTPFQTRHSGRLSVSAMKKVFCIIVIGLLTVGSVLNIILKYVQNKGM